MHEDENRNENGQFKKGNSGGPGRPRRAVESDYLAAMSAEVPMDRWREIVKRAVDDASNGNDRARDWLSRHLLPLPSRKEMPLFSLAVSEASGVDAIESKAQDERLLQMLFDYR